MSACGSKLKLDARTLRCLPLIKIKQRWIIENRAAACQNRKYQTRRKRVEFNLFHSFGSSERLRFKWFQNSYKPKMKWRIAILTLDTINYIHQFKHRERQKTNTFAKILPIHLALTVIILFVITQFVLSNANTRRFTNFSLCCYFFIYCYYCCCSCWSLRTRYSFVTRTR